jgi:hypothetical protein
MYMLPCVIPEYYGKDLPFKTELAVRGRLIIESKNKTATYMFVMFCGLNNCGNKSALSLVIGACRAVHVRRTDITPVF